MQEVVCSSPHPTYLTVRTQADVESHMDQVRYSARRLKEWIASYAGDPIELLRAMKFEPVGFHPIQDHALNIVEQINQTWTYAVPLAAARELLSLHPEAGGFRLAPGGHASIDLDIMSEVQGLVGVETFAAVNPTNNDKLDKNLVKLAQRKEQYRYVFFSSPLFAKTQRVSGLNATASRYGPLKFNLAVKPLRRGIGGGVCS